MKVIQILACLVGAAAGLPHEGMINTGDIRDVGVMFTEPGYKGFSSFLIEQKSEKACLPISPDAAGKPAGVNITSIMICTDSACTFFMGDKCEQSEGDNYSVAAEGPTDFETVDTPRGTNFMSYCCGPRSGNALDESVDYVLKGVPHINSSD